MDDNVCNWNSNWMEEAQGRSQSLYNYSHKLKTIIKLKCLPHLCKTGSQGELCLSR